MAINRKYLDQLKTVVCSLGTNCSCPVDVYLMHTELTEKDIISLTKLVQRMCGGCLHEIKIMDSFLTKAKTYNHFSKEMYYRIFASEFLPRTISRILWLDADVLILKDLKQLFNCDLQGNSIAVCSHREKDNEDPLVNRKAIERLGMQENDIYFNSGVLLMDLDKIRKNFQKERVLELIYEKSDMLIYPDQDILNILYQHDKLMLDWKVYNFQIHFDWKFPNEKDYLKNNVVIIHYAGHFKPWKYNSYHFSYKYYWKYYLLHGRKATYLANILKTKMYTLYNYIRKF